MSGQSFAADASNTPAARRLADHALSRDLQRLSPLAVARIKAFTLDTIAVGVAGAASLYAPKVRAFAQAQADSGDGRACVFGSGDWLGAREAAFCNAFLVHSQEFDCVHEAAVLHPFTVVIPVLLAEAARAPMTGPTFMAAAAGGVDIAAGLGVSATTPIKFFRPAVYGLFGAVAALGHARRLDAATLTNAFGYALSFASGTMQAHTEGTPALAIQIAHAARCAFDAVDLALLGLPGPQGAIDGPYGLLALFETGHDIQRLLGSLEDTARVEAVSWKPYPTGRAAHGGLDMMRAAFAAGVRADQVEQVEIAAPPLIHHLVGRPVRVPLEVNYARLCLPYLAATMLTRGALDLYDFTDAACANAAVLNLATRIMVVQTDHRDPAAFTPQSARILLRGGGVHRETMTDLPGAPVRPLSRPEQEDKVRACLMFGRPDDGEAIAQALIMAIATLDSCADVSRLAAIAGGHEGGRHGRA
jgi:2-methylcitrate dehydratase PrpD